MKWVLLGLGALCALNVVIFATGRPFQVWGLVIYLCLTPLFFAGAAYVVRYERRLKAAQQRLANRGKRARGMLLSISETGMTMNDNPGVKLRIRVEPDDEAPFELEETLIVSRLSIPRPGDPYIVVYDPADHSNFQLGIPDDRDAGSGADRLTKLAALRDRGDLTAEEFEALKGRLLDGGPVT